MLRAYFAALVGFRRRAGWCVILAIISGLAEALGIASVLPLLSGALPEQDGIAKEYLGLRGDDLVIVALVALVVLGLGSSVLRYSSDVAAIRLQAGVEESLRSRMTAALFRMDWPSFLHLSLGETGKSVLLEATQVGLGVYWLVIGLGYMVITATFVAVALVISPAMTVATLGFGLVMGLVYRAAGKRAGGTSRNLSGEASDLTEVTTNVLGNAKFYRSTGLSTSAVERADSAYGTWRRLFVAVQRYQPMTRLVFDMAGLVFISAVLAITLIARGDSPLAPLVFLALFYRLAPKLQQAQRGLLEARIQASWWSTWSERYDGAIAAREAGSGRRVPEGRPRLTFEEVRYEFSAHEVPAVHGMSWELAPGGCVGIVGESGGGKTTVLDLVTGLLVPTAGRVCLDGIDLREIDVEAWRSRIGLVMQDAPLFHGSIFENIAWGSAEPDRGRAERVIELAHLGDVIRRMPDGLDTPVGQHGARLSGGQRQRVALARALYGDPWLLVLDEATSALDSESEQVVQEALSSLKGSCSMLIVAHRLKTVELADRILVLARGEVIEDGSWGDLMAAGGTFCRMAAAQGIGS